MPSVMFIKKILIFSGSNETDNYLHLDLLKEKAKSCNDFEYKYINDTDHFYNEKELEIGNIILFSHLLILYINSSNNLFLIINTT